MLIVVVYGVFKIFIETHKNKINNKFITVEEINTSNSTVHIT